MFALQWELCPCSSRSMGQHQEGIADRSLLVLNGWHGAEASAVFLGMLIQAPGKFVGFFYARCHVAERPGSGNLHGQQKDHAKNAATFNDLCRGSLILWVQGL